MAVSSKQPLLVMCNIWTSLNLSDLISAAEFSVYIIIMTKVKPLPKNYGRRNSEMIKQSPLLGSSEPECVVWGALALTLQVSRVLGVAPVSMTRVRGGWRVTYCRRVQYYNYFVMLFLHGCLLTGLILDLQLDTVHSVRVRTPTARFSWIVELIVVTSVTTAGLVSGPARAQCMIRNLNILNNVLVKFSKSRRWRPRETRKTFMFLFILGFCVALYSSDYHTHILESYYHGKDSIVVLLYLAFFLEFIVVLLLELQFIYITLNIESALIYINRSLNDNINILDLQKRHKYSTMPGLLQTVLPIPQKRTIMVLEERSRYEDSLSKMEDEIDLLASCNVAVIRALAEISDSFSTVLLLLLGSLFLHLVITPYYVIAYLQNYKFRTLSVVNTLLYCFWHSFEVILIGEPGHRIQEQMTRTQFLVGHMLRRVRPDASLVNSLHMFYYEVLLNPLSLTPAGISQLTRPVVCAMFGSISTYITILIQFLLLDNSNNAKIVDG